MKMMPILKKTMDAFPGSFINHLNELILLPKWNVYFLLDDVETEEDFLCKMCEWISRDCCYARRYERTSRLIDYYRKNTERFNLICGTAFDCTDMMAVYMYLGNAANHDLTLKFVRSGFDLKILKGEKDHGQS